MTFILLMALYALLVFIWFICFLVLMSMSIGILTTQVPFVPVSRPIVEALRKAIPLKTGDVLYDLGSGDGRVVAALAEDCPTATAIGVEKASLPFVLSTIRFLFKPLKNAKILFKNFSHVSLTNATHVYMYLFPEVVEKLLPKFEKELKPGSTIISCDFPFKTRTPYKTIQVGEGYHKHMLYLYTF